MWVLKEQGARFEHRADSSDSAAGLTVDAGEPCLDEQSFANEGNCVTLNFPSSHDGRGFSFAKRVRRERGEGVRIIATGNLIPDQARMAFQCGFSEIHLSDELVSRHGETAWRAATMVAPDALYTKSGKAPSICDARHQHSVKIKSLTSAEAFEDLQRSAKGVLLDVRTSAEWQFVGRPAFERSVGIQWQTFPYASQNPNFLDEVADAGLTQETPIYVLCRSGVRSLAAAQALKAAGYKDLTNVSDGFEGAKNASGRRGILNGWKAAQLPWNQD
jgi:rhodanese-related sulfurtransferase/uncharacterized protein (DUF934 family)